MVIEPIVWRRSVRKYSGEPVLDEAIDAIVRAAQFAPTAMNRREVEFVVIKKQSVKDQLYQVLEQDFIKKAPVLILMAANKETSEFAEYDLALASGFVMIQAAALGLGTVWKHIGKDQREAVRKILNLPKSHVFINVIPVGYPADDLPDHSDAEFDPAKIHADIY